VAQVTCVALSIWPVMMGRAVAEDVASPLAAGRVYSWRNAPRGRPQGPRVQNLLEDHLRARQEQH
jgi:hypothetical protein